MAFLGIRIPHETGRLLSKIDVPGEKTSTSEMHITLLYLGDEWPISEISKAMEAAYDIVSKTKPFTAEVNKVSHFPKNPHDQDKYPIITRVESKELHELRGKLAKKFDKEGVEYSKLHPDYKPHVTLAYSEKEPEDVSFDPLEFSISEVVLWGGDHGDDRIFVTFPLAGPEVTKNSFLLQKASIFEKLANKPLPAFLTATVERRKKERAMM
jgi:2'-5' RNA ligase